MIGGIAVIARGVPRVPRDIDIAFSGADITLQAASYVWSCGDSSKRVDEHEGCVDGCLDRSRRAERQRGCTR